MMSDTRKNPKMTQAKPVIEEEDERSKRVSIANTLVMRITYFREDDDEGE